MNIDFYFIYIKYIKMIYLNISQQSEEALICKVKYNGTKLMVNVNFFINMIINNQYTLLI
jgi:hypothetical protein